MECTLVKNNFCHKLTIKLRGQRIALGLSTSKVREDTGIDINKIEHNGSNLMVFTLCKLLEYYGKSLGEFFGEMERDDTLK